MKNGQLIHSGALHEIIKVIDGKIWECRVTQAQAEELMAVYSSTNIRAEDDGVLLRLIAGEPPCATALTVAATLEDLYLYYFSEVNEHE